MFYFYCPNCKHENRVKKLPNGTMGNLRGGWGIPIHHYECPICHNLDAGFMLEKEGNDEVEQKYYQGVISYYQNIRGFKKYSNEK